MKTLPESDGIGLKVLVVDNDPGNQELLRGFLISEGYEYQSATRGDQALVSIEESPPDLLLLDIALPGLDGIEVCRRLHEDPTTTHIPVLLMTAHRRREKRLDGISAGARDFLLKPLDLPDLRIRLRNAGEMKRLYDQSQKQLRTITELESFRDSLVHMIVHDLKSPLTMVMGNLELMELFLPKEIGTEVREAIEGCQKGARKMNEMVSSILTVSKLESGKMELDLAEAPVLEVAKDAISLLGPSQSRVRFSISEGLAELKLQMDVDLIQRVIQNLLSNALDHSPEAETVAVQISSTDGGIRLAVVDRGPGVPKEFRERIFEKFSQAGEGKRARKGSVGLGLAFCRLAVEAHGGVVGLDAPEEGGSAFWFRLPA